jgi:diguanylate cyclase (GGDEF)-like protein/PAS domain S-box-containing protein
MRDRQGNGREAMSLTAWFRLRLALFLAIIALGWLIDARPAAALDAIAVDPKVDRIEITSRGEIWDNRGDSVQVETAAGIEGVVGRMDVKALTPGTNPNWLVFALTNRTDRHIERWLTADRYTSVGSGGVWPDLDASRIAAVTPSVGFVPERVKSDRADVFRITLEPGQTITFVAELSSERFSRIFLWKPLAYELKVRERQLFNGTLLGLTGLMAIFLTAIFAANHKAIFPTAALVAWCVLAYLCVDFGFFHKLFNLSPEDNAVYRAAGEASIAASLIIFLFTFLRLGLSHGLVRMLFGVWILAQLALVAVAVVDPRLSATFARLSFLLIGGAGAAIIAFLALRGQDRAMSMIPTWLLFLVWVFATAVTLTGRMSGDIVVAGLAAGLVLVVVLIGFTVTQFAFRSLESAYGATPDEQQIRALAVDGVGAATWEWNARRDEIKVSPVLEAQLGLNHGELCAKVEDFLQHVHAGDRDRFRLVLWSIQERSGGRIRIEFRLRHSDNSYRWYELEAASVANADRRNVRCVGLLRDITDPKRTHERLVQDAVQCRVTNLPNKAIFLDRLAVANQRAREEDGIRPTIIFIDLDRFRNINASLGLGVGDSLLLTVARRLRRHLGPHDTLARIGGDQFAILLLDAHDPRELAALAERIRRSLRSPINIAAQDVVLTGSLGIAVYEGDATSPEELLKGAEIAMYRAKRKGADRIEIYTPGMLSDAEGLPAEERELKEALEQGKMQVLYQPIVYLPTEELAGFEAVLRWEYARNQIVGHDHIVDLAESSDLIRKVGSFLLMQVLQAAKSWQTVLPRKEAPLFASVSISNARLFEPEVVDEWRQILGRHIVPANCLRLQIKEVLALENPERAIEMMRILETAGSEIVLDEFGASYSSLVYLQRFPANTIKIEKSIVQAGTVGEGDGAAVLRSVASLAHELGKRVLAEGVEIEEDVIFLRAIGCEYGQGLYYGEPMSSAEAADLLQLIAKSERGLDAPGLFRTRPKKAKKKRRVQRDAPQVPPTQQPHTGNGTATEAPNGGTRPVPMQYVGRNGTALPQPAPSKHEGMSRPPRSGPDDAVNDARRVIASLPNVTVRPIERPQVSRSLPASLAQNGRPPVPPRNPEGPSPRVTARKNSPTQPVPPPKAPASTLVGQMPNRELEPTVRLSDALRRASGDGSAREVRESAIAPPTQPSQPANPPLTQPDAEAKGAGQHRVDTTKAGASPSNGGAPVKPSAAAAKPLPFPPEPPSASRQDSLPGEHRNVLPEPTVRTAPPGLPFPPEETVGDSDRKGGSSETSKVPPSRPGSVSTVAGSAHRRVQQAVKSRPPVEGPPPVPNSEPDERFAHLPPGIAQSLARLAGKTGEPKGASARGKRAPEPVGDGTATPKKPDKP